MPIHPARIALTMLALRLASPVFGQGVKPMDAALNEAFPEAQVRRRTVFLTEAQRQRIEQAAGLELPSSLIYPYEIVEQEHLTAVVYFDVHRVRTRPQTLMIAAAPDGTIRHFEVLAFEEPETHRPPPAWYAVFLGRRLDESLEVGAGIDALSGATSTVRATTRAVRRLLAVHRELYETTAGTSNAAIGGD
jgi:hypothetical protein